MPLLVTVANNIYVNHYLNNCKEKKISNTTIRSKYEKEVIVMTKKAQVKAQR